MWYFDLRRISIELELLNSGWLRIILGGPPKYAYDGGHWGTHDSVYPDYVTDFSSVLKW